MTEAEHQAAIDAAFDTLWKTFPNHRVLMMVVDAPLSGMNGTMMTNIPPTIINAVLKGALGDRTDETIKVKDA